MLHLDYEPEYPTSDGKPMAETDVHREQMISLIKALEYHFRDEPDVYVSGNLLMFYERGDGHKHRSPDVLVALGVAKGERDNYKIWEEGKAPDLVFEITSRSTRTEDLGEKMGLYSFLGVREYVLFDPLEEYLEPRLRLYRLNGEGFIPVVGRPLLLSTINLELDIVDSILRLRSPLTKELIPIPEERAQLETERAESESERANRERKRAESERERAESERERAESERERADRAEQELRDLKAKFGLADTL